MVTPPMPSGVEHWLADSANSAISHVWLPLRCPRALSTIALILILLGGALMVTAPMPSGVVHRLLAAGVNLTDLAGENLTAGGTGC